MTKVLTMRLIPALMMAGFAGVASASGFQLMEQNASGLGNAFAGAGAVTENASVMFYNAAGIGFLPAGKSLSFGGNYINLSAKFHNTGSTAPTGQALGGEGGNAGGGALVPNGYFAMSINPQWSVGVGLGAPFGLKTEYSNDWMGREQGVTSDIKTVNLNPTVAYKPIDSLSVGVGLNYQRIDAKLTSMANVFAATSGALSGEVLNSIEGDDTGWGWNAGILWKVSPATRVGFSYRSTVKYHLTGTRQSAATASGALNSALNGNIYADIKLPDTASLSVHQVLSDKWEMMGDATWTGWTSMQDLTIYRAETNAIHVQNLYNWKNSWRIGLGGKYHYSDSVKLKFGVAYDNTPIPDERRAVRLPDESRIWLSFGTQYLPSKTSAIDLGLSYLFIKDPKISSNGDSTYKGTVVGDYSSNVWILGAQYSMSF